MNPKQPNQKDHVRNKMHRGCRFHTLTRITHPPCLSVEYSQLSQMAWQSRITGDFSGEAVNHILTASDVTSSRSSLGGCSVDCLSFLPTEDRKPLGCNEMVAMSDNVQMDDS